MSIDVACTIVFLASVASGVHFGLPLLGRLLAAAARRYSGLALALVATATTGALLALMLAASTLAAVLAVPAVAAMAGA